MSMSVTAPPAELLSRLAELMTRDEQRLRRRLDGLRKMRHADARAAALAGITAEVEAAEGRLAARRATVPALRYPDELPVSQRRDELLPVLRDHQVVIVAG